MEGIKDQTSGHVDLESFYAPGSLSENKEEPEESDQEDTVEGEAADESAEEDATEDEDADEESDEDEDDGEEDDDDDLELDEDEDEDDVDAKLKAAEKKRAGFQSEAAKLKNEKKQLEERLDQQQRMLLELQNQVVQNQNYQQPEPQGNADDLSDVKALLSGDPDDFPTKSEIIQILDKVEQRNRQGANRGQSQASQANNAAWIKSQPDFVEVNDYATKYNIASDPYFAGAMTDETGAFFAIRAKLQQDKLKKLESENKRLRKVAKKKKGGRIPKTGSSGPANRSGRSQKADPIEKFWTSVKW